MLQKFRERVNLKLYDQKETVMRVFRWLHIFVALSMVGVLVYYYGFKHSESMQVALLKIIEYSFAFYILRFIVKIIYDFNPLKYIRTNWFETVLILFLIVEGIAYNVTGNLLISRFFSWLGLRDFGDFSNVFIQLFFIIYIFTEVFKKRDFRLWFKVHPGLLFVFSIGAIVVVGTGLLMLPEMSTISGSLNFTDALFTSMSSASVTGLTTVDISSILSFKGQVVVLFLIQIGALNTIAFAALYLLLAKFGIGLKQHAIMEDFMNKSTFVDAGDVFFRIIKWSIVIELIGFILIYFLFFDVSFFETSGDHLFHSIFHSVSSFNNAGLSIIPDGLMYSELQTNYLLHFITLILFFMGGFGMLYLFELLSFDRIKERLKSPWKGLSFPTKITLYTTLILLALGAIVFFIFEYNKSLEGQPWYGIISTTLFESMTTRNAGFSTVDTGALSLPVLVFFLFLMFIGAGSGSSGGGVRVTTFAVMIASVVSTIKGKPNTELFKRSLSNEIVLKAYSILLFFIFGNLIGIFVLTISEYDLIESGKFTLIDIIFEHVSAASTVGLSTGITGEMSTFGQYVLMVAMFIGRVGTLTLAYLFGKQVSSKNYKYPSGHTMIG